MFKILARPSNHKIRNSRYVPIAYAIVAGTAFAGGVDVSPDALRSDYVTLTTIDGAPIDINRDGKVDLVVGVNQGGSEYKSRWYFGNGDGTFRTGKMLTAGASSDILAGDLNGDLFLDLVQARRDNTDLYYLGNGIAMSSSTAVSADTTRTLSAALGDLDLDGDLDLVTGNGRAGNRASNPAQPNRFYLNRIIPSGNVGFTAGADISEDADKTRDIVLVDLDGDGDLDVVAANDQTTPNSNRIYLNEFLPTQTMQFAAGIDIGDPDDETSKVLVGDLDSDGDPDLVFLNHGRPNRFHLNQLMETGGSFSFGAAVNVHADADGTSGGTLFDADGDGDLDLLVTNLLPRNAGESGYNKLYLNRFVETGAVTFAAGIDIGVEEEESREVAVVDLNGDGHIDIVIANEDVPDRRYLNNGTSNPFTNLPPSITNQANTLSTTQATALTIDLTDIAVVDADNVFPADFLLTVQPGAGYSLDGNTLIPDAGVIGDLTVPVRVNDGTDDSAAFELTVEVTESGGMTVMLADVADTFSNKGRPNTNFGSKRDMRAHGPNNKKIAFVRFDVSALSGTVAAATLQLYVKDLPISGIVTVHAVQGAWTESGLTYNNRPAYDPTPIASFALTSADIGKVVDLDITPLVQQWLASPAAAYGLALGSPNLHGVFYTRETPNAPVIEVELR